MARSVSRNFLLRAIPANHLWPPRKIGSWSTQNVYQAGEGGDTDDKVGHEDVQLYAPRHHRHITEIRIEPDERPQVRRNCGGKPRGTPGMKNCHVNAADGLNEQERKHDPVKAIRDYAYFGNRQAPRNRSHQTDNREEAEDQCGYFQDVESQRLTVPFENLTRQEKRNDVSDQHGYDAVMEWDEPPEVLPVLQELG